MARIVYLLVILFIASTLETCWSLKGKRQSNASSSLPNCTCGVFLSSQVVKGSASSPVGNPAITVEVEENVPCGPIGYNQCSTKCLQELVKFMPTSSSIICGSVDREVYKEKANLFLNVCNQGWIRSKVSTSKEVCCKNSVDYKCPAA